MTSFFRARARLLAAPLALLACRPVTAPAPLAADDDDDIAAAADDSGARYERALARLRDIDGGLPRVEDGYIWWGEHGDDGRSAQMRREAVAGAPVEVVLDEQAEVSAVEAVDVGSLTASPDGKQVAFSADVGRSDRYGVHVKDLSSGRIKRVVDDADFSVAWSKDGDLYFTRFGGDDRPRSLWRMQAAPDVAADDPQLVHELPAGEPGEMLVADVDGETDLFIVPEARDGVTDRDGVTSHRLRRQGTHGEHAAAAPWRRPSVR